MRTNGLLQLQELESEIVEGFKDFEHQMFYEEWDTDDYNPPFVYRLHHDRYDIDIADWFFCCKVCKETGDKYGCILIFFDLVSLLFFSIYKITYKIGLWVCDWSCAIYIYLLERKQLISSPSRDRQINPTPVIRQTALRK